MKRLTKLTENSGYTVDSGDIESAIQRLAQFENAYEDLINSQLQLPNELEEMRKDGKEKTVKYREAVAQKLINMNIIMFFKKHNINIE